MFFWRIRELERELAEARLALQNEKEIAEGLKAVQDKRTHKVSVECAGCKNLLKWEDDDSLCRTKYGCKLNNTCQDREE